MRQVRHDSVELLFLSNHALDQSGKGLRPEIHLVLGDAQTDYPMGHHPHPDSSMPVAEIVAGARNRSDPFFKSFS